jgi:hypothetical protein
MGAAVVVVLASIAAVLWSVWPNSSPVVPAHAPLPSLRANPVTTVGGQDLLATLRKGEAATYHLTYQVQGDAQQVGGTLTLSLWQAPPDTREDSVLVSQGKTISTASISTPAATHLCTQSQGSAWTCRTVPRVQVALGGATGIVSAITATVSGHGVVMSKQTIDGYAVTCYTVQVSASDQPKLCAMKSGIPVLLADNDVSYRLVALSQRVDDAVFTMPTRG